MKMLWKVELKNRRIVELQNCRMIQEMVRLSLDTKAGDKDLGQYLC